MNRQEYMNMKYKLKVYGLTIPRLETLNMVRHHNRNESRKHWITKCICSKILADLGIPHLVEYEFPNKIVADVFNIRDRVAYEFETNKTPKKEQLKYVGYHSLTSKGIVKDVMVIDISKYPDSITGIERELRFKMGI